MDPIPTDRATQRLHWARVALRDPDLQLQPASSDASFRSYWRPVGGASDRLIMDAPPPAEDIGSWLNIHHCLHAAGIHVPEVHASERTLGFALIEDFGRTLYLDALTEDNADALYSKAMDVLQAMQTRVDSTCLAIYDASFLRREMDLLEPWFLQRHLHHATTPAERTVLADAIGILLDNAIEQPGCFVHRDFHSRNLMLTADASPGVIDFQGALRGPITYDLVSLLRDCYIRWDDARVDRWRESYRQRLLANDMLPAGVSAERFARWFDLTGLQRHIKVLGLFCRLALRDGKAGYLDDLPRVLGYVGSVARRYPELRDLAELLEAATRGRDIRRPGADTGTDRSACAP